FALFLLGSQTATPCTSGSRKKCSMTRKPCAPTPMNAMFTLSLGGTYPAPPNTRRGTIVKPIAAAAVCPMNLRRESAPSPKSSEASDDHHSPRFSVLPDPSRHGPLHLRTRLFSAKLFI